MELPDRRRCHFRLQLYRDVVRFAVVERPTLLSVATPSASCYCAPPPCIPIRMSDPVDALLIDLVTWIAREDRDYLDVMDAWRTSCPRLPVWEEANARGLVTRKFEHGRGPIVCVTARGRAFLAASKASAACAR